MRNIKSKLKSVLMLATILWIWQVASTAVNKELFLPSPVKTYEAIKSLFANYGIFKHLGATFGRVTVAIFITGVISFPLGMAIAWCKPVQAIFGPIVKTLRFIPVTVFSPMLVLLLGIDEGMKITFLVVATLFSFLPAVIQTCSEVNERIKETAYTMGFSYVRTIVHVLFPYVLPSLVQSLITTYGVGWTFVVIAEVTNAQYGLGHLMYINSARGRTAMVYAAIIIISVVSFLFDKFGTSITKKIFKWRYRDEECA